MTVSYTPRLRRLYAATLLGLAPVLVWAQDQSPQTSVQPYEHVSPESSKEAVAILTHSTKPRMEEPARPKRRRIMHELDSVAGADEAPAFEGGQGEHPLMPALRRAREGIKSIEKIQDYSATVVKRERLFGKVGGYQYMFIKVRHKPFSVYTRFLAPDRFKGQECLYVEGQNGGKMWAHGTGLEKKLFKTVSIAPDGPIAIRGQRYPLTEIGMLNLTCLLIQVAEQDINYGECDVKFIEGAKINGRGCTVIQVVHPVPRRNFCFHLARIFIDDERNIPIRYEAYDWPEAPGKQPQLIEEYTYLNLKLNQGFADKDFSRDNPNYEFR